MVAVLAEEFVMQAGIWELREDRGGAQVKVFRQEVFPLFRTGQTSIVGVSTGLHLIHGAA